MSRENSKVLIYFLSGVICFLAAFIVLQSVRTNDTREADTFENVVIESSHSKTVQSGAVQEAGTIVVYITGAVKTPGIIKLKSGSRVCDALELAGGLSEKADAERVNLSAPVQDSEHIYVPFIHRSEDAYKDKTPAAERKAVRKAPEKTEAPLHININKADLQELDKLPGVGPKTAEKIIEYRRTKGYFRNIKEIMEVKGIGPKKYEKMKEFITVGN